MHDLRALVVDDSKVGRLTMMKKLEAMGVRVELAESGQQALDYLAVHRPGVVFMDHMMPDMDGFETTRRIKASPATRDIPVIVVSGNEGEEFVREARAAGAIDAIAKPPATEVLEALLASLPKRAAEAAAEPAPRPAPAAPAPAMDLAEARALVERLVGASVAPLRADFMAELDRRLRAEAGNQHGTLAQWGERLDRQAAALDELRRGAAGAGSLGDRVRALEERLVPLEARAGEPGPDPDALRADLEQRLAAGLAGLQDRVGLLAPELESLRQGFRDSRARADDQAARAEQRANGWDSRLEALSGDLDRVARDLQSLRAAQAEMEQRAEQRLEQRIARIEEAVSAARQAAVPAREEVDEPARALLQAIQSELGELRERLSDTRLRERVAETLGSLQPAMAAAPPVEARELLPPVVDAGLQAEMERLKGKVKTLTALVAIGGAALLALVGVVLLRG